LLPFSGFERTFNIEIPTATATGGDSVKTRKIEYIPNPAKPERVATKAPRHKARLLVNIHLCVLVSWWRKYFATKCTKINSKQLKGGSPCDKYFTPSQHYFS
jgi:hypothetical protein